MTPFDALPAQIDLDATNAKTAYRAADSDRLDFAHADAVDAPTLNDILRGATLQQAQGRLGKTIAGS
jgi:hypothetical protein